MKIKKYEGAWPCLKLPASASVTLLAPIPDFQWWFAKCFGLSYLLILAVVCACAVMVARLRAT
jgi:hypothetical protein